MPTHGGTLDTVGTTTGDADGMTSRTLVAIMVAAVSLGTATLCAKGQSLDALAGRWTLHDPQGAVIGESVVVVEQAGAMLREERRVGTQKPQLLWFAHFEAGGWRQLFAGVQGTLRTFDTQSEPGAWPVLMGATVVTQDGQATQYRMTITRPNSDELRRILESSRDGVRWSVVFDYTYRRLAK